VRLSTQAVPIEVDGPLWSNGHRCKEVRLCGEGAQQAENLKPGDKLHVVLSFYDFYCQTANAYTDLEAAKARFREEEAGIWRELKSWRGNIGYRYGMMKFNQYHCEMLENRVNSRAQPTFPFAWYHSDNACAAWLVTLVIDGPALNLDEEGNWPPGNLEVRRVSRAGGC
jgi:hypothetical protein